jgi:transcriptional regulator with XRE-family HTH domain
MDPMDDQTFGVIVRTTRIRQRKRQRDVGRAAGVSASTVGRIERGMFGPMSLDAIRKVCATLEIRVEVQARSRGADIDRMLGARHARLAEAVIRALLEESPEWTILPEVSFNVWGERGIVDILAWHPRRRALLIIEIKTEIVDVGGMIGTLDRKRRLGREIVEDRGWIPDTISTWLIVAGGRTNERRLAAHKTTLQTAYPDSRRRVTSWMADPVGAIAAMSTWPTAGTHAVEASPVTRVRTTRSRRERTRAVSRT